MKHSKKMDQSYIKKYQSSIRIETNTIFVHVKGFYRIKNLMIKEYNNSLKSIKNIIYNNSYSKEHQNIYIKTSIKIYCNFRMTQIHLFNNLLNLAIQQWIQNSGQILNFHLLKKYNSNMIKICIIFLIIRTNNKLNTGYQLLF